MGNKKTVKEWLAWLDEQPYEQVDERNQVVWVDEDTLNEWGEVAGNLKFSATAIPEKNLLIRGKVLAVKGTVRPWAT